MISRVSMGPSTTYERGFRLGKCVYSIIILIGMCVKTIEKTTSRINPLKFEQ